MTLIVQLDGISRTFPGSPPVEALRDVDLAIEENEYVSIAGPSGSGKSTLLNVIGCLDRPTAGTYRLTGIDVGSLNDGKRSALRGRSIGFVFQAFHLLPYRTVLENVTTGLIYNRIRRGDRRRRAEDALELVDLTHRLEFTPGQLSGGERQRVAIARALAMHPDLLLCDEPTGNLDSKTTESILDLLDELVDEGLTLVIVTHEPAVSTRSDRHFQLVDGQLSEGGP